MQIRLVPSTMYKNTKLYMDDFSKYRQRALIRCARNDKGIPHGLGCGIKIHLNFSWPNISMHNNSRLLSKVGWRMGPRFVKKHVGFSLYSSFMCSNHLICIFCKYAGLASGCWSIFFRPYSCYRCPLCLLPWLLTLDWIHTHVGAASVTLRINP
jgi:hypothetical protein